jgi:ribokinase
VSLDRFRGTRVAVWGEPTLCFTVTTATPVSAGGSVTGSITRHAGGSAFATAVGVAHLGAGVEFFGPFGTDAAGAWMLQYATERGVRCQPVPAGASRQTIVIVAPDGERSMVTDLGDAFSDPYANLYAVDPAVHGVLHCSLSSIARDGTGGVERFVRRAASAVPVSIDLGAASVLRALGTARLRALLEAVDPVMLFANEDEAATFGELVPELRSSAPCIFEKRGAAPCVVRSRGEETLVSNPNPVEALDTTGAGDAFAAGVLAAWSDGTVDPVELARAGHRYAARAVAVVGTVVPEDDH